tara:strand:- start:423 stop:662 length:240 start_codon:yes stop_codon:yes gene_type:complete
MIDCCKLEEIIEQWYFLNSIPKPTCSMASKVSYKSMISFSRRDLLKKMTVFFKNLEIGDITITEKTVNKPSLIKIQSKI